MYCVCMFTCRYQCYTSYWITWQKCTENVLLSTSQYPQTGRPQQWFCWPIFLGKRGNSILALTYGMWLSQRRKIIFSYRYVFPATLKEKKKIYLFSWKTNKKAKMHLMSLRYQLFQEWDGTLIISVEKDIIYIYIIYNI